MADTAKTRQSDPVGDEPTTSVDIDELDAARTDPRVKELQREADAYLRELEGNGRSL
jgi:hypothetical protein